MKRSLIARPKVWENVWNRLKQLFDKKTAWRLGVFVLCFMGVTWHGFALRPTLSSMPCWSVVWPRQMSLKTPFWRPTQLGKCDNVAIVEKHGKNTRPQVITDKLTNAASKNGCLSDRLSFISSSGLRSMGCQSGRVKEMKVPPKRWRTVKSAKV